jgi:hypothetical protein
MSDASKKFVTHQSLPAFLVVSCRLPHVAANFCAHWRRGSFFDVCNLAHGDNPGSIPGTSNIFQHVSES